MVYFLLQIMISMVMIFGKTKHYTEAINIKMTIPDNLRMSIEQKFFIRRKL